MLCFMMVVCGDLELLALNTLLIIPCTVLIEFENKINFSVKIWKCWEHCLCWSGYQRCSRRWFCGNGWWFPAHLPFFVWMAIIGDSQPISHLLLEWQSLFWLSRLKTSLNLQKQYAVLYRRLFSNLVLKAFRYKSLPTEDLFVLKTYPPNRGPGNSLFYFFANPVRTIFVPYTKQGSSAGHHIFLAKINKHLLKLKICIDSRK